jgi:hypothetical protein
MILAPKNRQSQKNKKHRQNDQINLQKTTFQFNNSYHERIIYKLKTIKLINYLFNTLLDAFQRLSPNLDDSLTD